MKRIKALITLLLVCVLFICTACDIIPVEKPPVNTDIPPIDGEQGGDYNVTTTPSIIPTKYPTDHTIIADYFVDTSYGVDPTGANDSSDALQRVLRECADNGGGLVFLPRGKYLITKNVTIPQFVYLQGEYNNPDASDFNGDYGTVILAKPAPSVLEHRNNVLGDRDDVYTNFPSLFTIGGSSGIIGLTIYYPEQDIHNVVPYPYAIEVPSFAGAGGHHNHHTPVIKNVNLINAYKGIIAGGSASELSGGGAAAFEQAHFENIKGTFLYHGLSLYVASEAGTVKDITIDSHYWTDYTNGAVLQAEINAFTKKYTTGMYLADLEWLFFTDISIKNVAMGIRTYDCLRKYITPTTVYFIGQFYNLHISDTLTAMRVDNMYPNFGMTITNSYLEGSVYALNERDTTMSKVKLVNTTLVGDTYGDSIVQSVVEEAFRGLTSRGELDYNTKVSVPNAVNYLYNVLDYGADNTGETDASHAIQEALDDAHANEGGIVYMPAGYYLLQDNLIVYANTELRGCGGEATRDQAGLSKGTVILGDYGYYIQDLAVNADALITLIGEHSGIRGIRFFYFNNKPSPRKSERYKYHSYVVRVLANNCYVTCASLVGVPYGIEVKNAHNCTISQVSGTFYDIGIHAVNSDNLVIDEMIENAAVVSRTGFALVPATQLACVSGWPTDTYGLSDMYAYITRPNTIFFVTENCQNVSIVHCSAFGIKQFYYGTNSSARVLSSNSDNCSSHIFRVDGGSLNVVNMFKFNDTETMRIENGGVYNAFNVLTLHFTTSYVLDPDYVNGVAHPDAAYTTTGKDVNDLPTRWWSE